MNKDFDTLARKITKNLEKMREVEEKLFTLTQVKTLYYSVEEMRDTFLYSEKTKTQLNHLKVYLNAKRIYLLTERDRLIKEKEDIFGKPYCHECEVDLAKQRVIDGDPDWFHRNIAELQTEKIQRRKEAEAEKRRSQKEPEVMMLFI